MPQQALDNLVRIGQLKAEPRNAAEVGRMLAMASTRLADSRLGTLSAEGRFTSVYNAAHAALGCLALARLSQRKPLYGFPVLDAYPQLARRHVGAFWIALTRNVTSRNMRDFLRLRNPPSWSCTTWWSS